MYYHLHHSRAAKTPVNGCWFHSKVTIIVLSGEFLKILNCTKQVQFKIKTQKSNAIEVMLKSFYERNFDIDIGGNYLLISWRRNYLIGVF